MCTSIVVDLALICTSNAFVLPSYWKLFFGLLYICVMVLISVIQKKKKNSQHKVRKSTIHACVCTYVQICMYVCLIVFIFHCSYTANVPAISRCSLPVFKSMKTKTFPLWIEKWCTWLIHKVYDY